MRTHDMLKAAPATSMILAPCASLEMWGGATFDVALRWASSSAFILKHVSVGWRV